VEPHEEFNPLTKRWIKGLKKIALIYPNLYRAGISNLGLQQIYSEINSLDSYFCERFYKDVFNGLKSIESGSPLKEFNKLFFSIQYEEDYSNAIKIASKNPNPENIAGGPCIMENPVPLFDHFKSFFIGEADGVVRDILAGKSPNIYENPSYPKKIKRRWVKLEKHLDNQIIGDGAYGRSLLLEIGRGCKRKCRFCIVRQIYRPCRWRKLDSLLETAEKNRKHVDKVALIAPSATDYPKIKDLISELINMGYMVSPSSIRADTLDEELIDLLKRAGLKSITIAPEAGSEKVREIINKEISEEDVLRAADLSSGNFNKIKLYFMIGLPKEDEEDVKSIIELSKKVKNRIQKVSVSINPLVPKPHTPFQWLSFGGDNIKTPEENIAELKRKMKLLNKELRKLKVRVNIEDVDKFAVQTIISRGDEKVGKALKTKIRVKEFDEYLRKIDLDKELPWDFIDHGYKKERLIKEYSKVLE